MTDYPHVPAAFINAISEEGTMAEAVAFLQKQWNESCALRAELKALRGVAASSRDDKGAELHAREIDAEFARITGLYFDALNEITALRAELKALRTPAASPPLDGKRELMKIAAECHRTKWQFDLSEDFTPSKASARALIIQAFREIHRIGDLAMAAYAVTRPHRAPIEETGE